MKKKVFSTKIMAEVALLAALAVVLDLLQSAICKFFLYGPMADRWELPWYRSSFFRIGEDCCAVF